VFAATLLAVTAWVIVIGVLASRGFFAHFSTLPPRPFLLVIIPLPIIIAIAFSKKFQSLALAIPEHWLIFFQSFRIVVELLLWRAFLLGALPVQMSLEGRNWDIISGVLAIMAGWIVLNHKPGCRIVAIAYNFIGISLLLNVLVVAVLSMPTPIRYFMNEPSVEKLAQFPMIYLPSVLVVLAYSFHIFSLRQLWLKRKESKQALTDHAERVASKENIVAG
jgi:hypothetical protein